MADHSFLDPHARPQRTAPTQILGKDAPTYSKNPPCRKSDVQNGGWSDNNFYPELRAERIATVKVYFHLYGNWMNIHVGKFLCGNKGEHTHFEL